jgi:hypothetical protein
MKTCGCGKSPCSCNPYLSNPLQYVPSVTPGGQPGQYLAGNTGGSGNYWTYLQYANNLSLIADGSGNFFLPNYHEGGAVYDQNGSTGLVGQGLWYDHTTMAALWSYPQYANGVQMTDSASTLYYSGGTPLADASDNLYLSQSGGDFYDATGVSSNSLGVGYVLGGNTSGGPTWQFPAYPNGTPLFGIPTFGSTLILLIDPTFVPIADSDGYHYAGQVGFYDSTGSLGSPGFVFAIDVNTGLPTWELAPYVPATPADWATIAPATLAEALDRLAAWIVAQQAAFPLSTIPTLP